MSLTHCENSLMCPSHTIASPGASSSIAMVVQPFAPALSFMYESVVGSLGICQHHDTNPEQSVRKSSHGAEGRSHVPPQM
ncbi:MAG: hypothetical protein U0414_15285 [Polyangiaceae bacterium]